MVVGSVKIDRVACERNGAEYFNACQAHQTDVSAGTKVGVTRQKLIELSSAFIEGDYTEDGVNTGNNANEDGRGRNK